MDPVAPGPAPAESPRTLLSPDFLARLDALSLVSRKILAGKLRGERRSRKKGESLEFADYRNYAQGDDLRRVDWSLFARLERLFVKLFQAEEDLSVYLILDGSNSMDFGSVNKFDYARKVAAAVAYIGLSNLDRVSLSTHTVQGEQILTNLRGKKQTAKLFDFLGKLRPGGLTDLHGACRRFILRHRRPGICLLISDFLDPAGFDAPLKALTAARMDAFAVHVLAPEEVTPVVAGDFLLVDSETGERLDVTASRRLVENYRKTVRGFCSSLQQFCAARGIAYLFASTDLPFEALVLNYLRSAGVVK
jgi:uncharacterized protein (DUF58 family)